MTVSATSLPPAEIGQRSHGLWRHTGHGGYAPLSGPIQVDVVVVGGGFTGLSSALHLAQAGMSVAVVEAGQPGFGASGRNGGQVIPGLKYYPHELVKMFGDDLGGRIATLTAGAADLVFGLIAEHGIACSAVRAGWVQPAHHVNALPRLRDRYEALKQFGAPVSWMAREEVAETLGTDVYHGGWHDARGGTIQPLAYAQGLAAAAAKAGVRIFGDTRATALARRDQRWVLSTDGKGGTAEVVADWAVLGTNGYTDALLPDLRHTLIALESAQTATVPLPPDLAAKILPTRVSVSDSRRSLFYFRISPDGRFVMGGRGAFFGTTGEGRFAWLQRRARSIYPDLAGIDWAETWSGRVAMTRDHLPHLHEPQPRLIAALGYNGRGIAMATLMGKVVSEKITKGADLFPVSPIQPIPMPFLHKAVASAVGVAYRTIDRFM